MNHILLIFFSLIIITSCSEKTKKKSSAQGSNRYASGFEITQVEGATKLRVINPFEQAQNISIDYYLIEKGNPIPESLSKEKVIFTPIEKIICLSTSHIAFLDAINETDKIVGISGTKYVSNKMVSQMVSDEKVVDVGYGQNLNYELILQQKPDLIMVYGIGSEVSAAVRKLEDLGLNAVMNAEYLEESPLGKAEWIKFVAAFFQKDKQANHFFLAIENDYNRLKELATNNETQPKVLVGLPYKDNWWIPGGNSYLATLINDAGGEYVGKENTSHESYVISFENALMLGAQADVWINTGALNSKKEILSTDSRFGQFPVFNDGKIFNNNGKMSNSGGNDFWESGTVYPNLILKDLIKVFYPELLKDKQLTYYKEIK